MLDAAINGLDFGIVCASFSQSSDAVRWSAVRFGDATCQHDQTVASIDLILESYRLFRKTVGHPLVISGDKLTCPRPPSNGESQDSKRSG